MPLIWMGWSSHKPWIQTDQSRDWLHGFILGNLDFEDLNWEVRKYDTQKAYGDSKLANLYFTYELARRLNKEGDHPRITVAHPGWTATDLQRNSTLMSGMNKFLRNVWKWGFYLHFELLLMKTPKPESFMDHPNWWIWEDILLRTHRTNYPMMKQWLDNYGNVQRKWRE